MTTAPWYAPDEEPDDDEQEIHVHVEAVDSEAVAHLLAQMKQVIEELRSDQRHSHAHISRLVTNAETALRHVVEALMGQPDPEVIVNVDAPPAPQVTVEGPPRPKRIEFTPEYDDFGKLRKLIREDIY